MKQGLAVLGCGVVFGTALSLAGCGNPQVILGFLDVTGAFRPHLAAVIATALALNLVLWPVVLRRGRPLLGASFELPTRTDIDALLVLGACLFGIGWGLSGYCAGPALVALVASPVSAATYLGAMICGYLLYALATAPRARAKA